MEDEDKEDKSVEDVLREVVHRGVVEENGGKSSFEGGMEGS